MMRYAFTNSCCRHTCSNERPGTAQGLLFMRLTTTATLRQITNKHYMRHIIRVKIAPPLLICLSLLQDKAHPAPLQAFRGNKAKASQKKATYVLKHVKVGFQNRLSTTDTKIQLPVVVVLVLMRSHWTQRSTYSS